MRLQHLLEDRKAQLAMQQDFIDTFPDEWHFKLDGKGGLIASRDGDGPCWLEDQTFWKDHPNGGAQDINWNDEIKQQLKAAGIDVRVSNTATGARTTGRTHCDADIEFSSYADAFKYFIMQEGGWDSYAHGLGVTPMNSGEFSAHHVLPFIGHLHKGTKHVRSV